MIRWILPLVLAAGLEAQQPPEDDARVLAIAFAGARAELAVAESAYARTRHLRDRSLVSSAELEAVAATRERAILSLLERWIVLAGGTPRVRVISARKARSADGSSMVRIVVAVEPWAIGPDFTSLPADVVARMRAAGTREAFISIKDEPGAAGTAIGSPYERRIDLSRSESPGELRFRLLRDVDAVVVTLAVGGRADERKVWLEPDATEAIAIQPLPFSQEADLGTEAAYDLTIERFGAGDVPLRLLARGLPPDVAAVFTDAGTGTRIGQLRFAAGEHQRRVRLTVVLPPGESASLTVDSAYRFLAIAGTGDALDRAPQLRAPESVRPGVGVAELELVPRGVGRVELRAFNLFHEGQAGAAIVVSMVLRNAGSRTLDHCRLRADLPPGWTLRAEPGDLRAVAPGAEHQLRLTIVPDPGAEIGDYEARLHVEGTAGRTRLSTDPTILRLRLRGSRSGTAAAGLVATVLVLLAAAVAATRRLARR